MVKWILRFGRCLPYNKKFFKVPNNAGQDKANPMAQNLTLAMMLRHSFNLDSEAKTVEQAIDITLGIGIRTTEIMHTNMHLPIRYCCI